MSTSILAVNPSEINTKTIEISGRRYQIARLTPHCWLFTALRTGKTAQFRDTETMWLYIAALTKHLQHKTQPHTPALLPAPKVAGLLPPFAGMVPGQCQSWLNSHDSPLATDGWVIVTRRGHQYCPYCLSRYHAAMDDFGSKAA